MKSRGCGKGRGSVVEQDHSGTTMSTPERQLPWYQFSLRSLLLLVALVAILCSIGVSTKWSVSAAIAASLLIGGVAGGMVAGTRAGVVVGAVYSIPLVFFAASGLIFLTLPISLVRSVDWMLVGRIAVAIGGILGGVAGGLIARSSR